VPDIAIDARVRNRSESLPRPSQACKSIADAFGGVDGFVLAHDRVGGFAGIVQAPAWQAVGQVVPWSRGARRTPLSRRTIVASCEHKSFASPGETRTFEKGRVDLMNIGGG
jgi:hypothetical protein